MTTIGQVFGLWTAIRPSNRKHYIVCRCACGLEKEVYKYNLIKGKSSGCANCSNKTPHSDIGRKFVGVPSDVLKKLLNATGAAISRCTDPDYEGYEHYGHRGIMVKFDSREDFVKHLLELSGHNDFSLVLDRIDNDGHYEAGNLRFVTRSKSQSNRRVTTLTDEDVIDIRRRYSEGFTQTQLAIETGLSQSSISQIVNNKAWRHI